jgi:hypothetical protein
MDFNLLEGGVLVEGGLAWIVACAQLPGGVWGWLGILVARPGP